MKKRILGIVLSAFIAVFGVLYYIHFQSVCLTEKAIYFKGTDEVDGLKHLLKCPNRELFFREPVYEGAPIGAGYKPSSKEPHERLNWVSYLRCPADKPLMSNKGKCYSCDETEGIDVRDDGKCSEVCPNRSKSGWGYCFLSCPADKPLMDGWGGCYSCDETDRVDVGYGYGYDSKCSEVCPNRSESGVNCVLKECPADKPLMDEWGSCYSCDETDGIHVEDGKCSEVCPNRSKSGWGYCFLSCPADKPLMDNEGKCYSCDETDRVDVGKDGKCSEVCPNRSESDRNCVLKECPADKPLMSNKGKCHSCDETGSVDVGYDSKCSEICSNRVKYDNRYCALPCPPDKPLMDEWGNCHSCDETDSVDVGENGMCSEICPNRSESDRKCVLKECPADKPLMGEWGSGYSCYSCDETDGVSVGENGKCSEICPNRVKHDNWYCALPCPPDNPLMDNNDICYPCDTEMHVITTWNACSEVCPNREKDTEHYCILKEPRTWINGLFGDY